MIDEFHARLGENLKAARLNENLNVQDAADLVGINRTTLASYERGDRRPDIETLSRLAGLYWKPLQELIPHELAWETKQAIDRGISKPRGIWDGDTKALGDSDSGRNPRNGAVPYRPGVAATPTSQEGN